MKLFTTSIQAVDPYSREVLHWMGPNVPGIDRADAQRFCNQNGLGYCRVIDEFAGEIPDGKINPLNLISQN